MQYSFSSSLAVLLGYITVSFAINLKNTFSEFKIWRDSDDNSAIIISNFLTKIYAMTPHLIKESHHTFS